MKYAKTLLALIVSAILLWAGQAGAAGTPFFATIDADGVQRVDILAGSYFFSPGYIVVKVNVPVEFRVKKEAGMTPHNIILKAPEAGIDFSQDLGKETTVIPFTPTKPGKYPFYCDKKVLFFKSHKERGMEGILEVTE
jgi:plastocyanin domain-containing protein